MRKRLPAVAVLSSGGIESGTLLADLSEKHTAVYPVYIRCGLIWETMEIYWLRRFLRALKGRRIPLSRKSGTGLQPVRVLSLPMQDLYGPHWSLTGHRVPDGRSEDASVYLPGRNLILISKAAVFCGMKRIDTLVLGHLKGNPFPDSTRRFLNTLQRSIAQALDMRFSILTPYRNNSKAMVIRKARRLPLHLTFSCMRPGERDHCGDCNKCTERRNAFRKAGIPDQTVYRGDQQPGTLRAR